MSVYLYHYINPSFCQGCKSNPSVSVEVSLFPFPTVDKAPSSSLPPAAAVWSACLSHSSCITHASNEDQPLIWQVLPRRRFQVNHSFIGPCVTNCCLAELLCTAHRLLWEDIHRWFVQVCWKSCCSVRLHSWCCNWDLNLGFLPLSRWGGKWN